ncbi:hypothetical protein NBRC116602_09330 [Hyphomicrobiales bacterium 4NK60-0047b]|jgi:hypothetical protein
MSDDLEHGGVLDEIPEPGVFSGICTLLGGLIGLFIVGSLYLYGPADGPVASAHLGVVIPLGLLFAFLLAAFTFLLGWIVETVWPLLGMLLLVTVFLLAPLSFYFGFDNLMAVLKSLF